MDMLTFYLKDRMLDIIKYCCSLSIMPCRQNWGYGVIGKKKRAGIWRAVDLKGFTIKHVRLGKKSEKQTKSFFQASGMHFGRASPPANGVCQMGSRSNFKKNTKTQNMIIFFVY